MDTNTRSLITDFTEQSLLYFNENTPRIEKCLNLLNEEQVWLKPNGSSNSVGNLILHLIGNITQYVLSGLGNIPDKRERDLEFLQKGGLYRSELLERLNVTVDAASKVIRDLTEDELLKKRTVQGFEKSGIGIIIHVVEHYSYHTGQISFWTKVLTNNDLGFYAGRDLNKKNDQ